MRRQFSFPQYRGIDLALFGAMLCISEGLLVTSATRWFPDQLYTVSVVGALTAIASPPPSPCSVSCPPAASA